MEFPYNAQYTYFSADAPAMDQSVDDLMRDERFLSQLAEMRSYYSDAGILEIRQVGVDESICRIEEADPEVLELIEQRNLDEAKLEMSEEQPVETFTLAQKARLDTIFAPENTWADPLPFSKHSNGNDAAQNLVKKACKARRCLAWGKKMQRLCRDAQLAELEQLLQAEDSIGVQFFGPFAEFLRYYRKTRILLSAKDFVLDLNKFVNQAEYQLLEQLQAEGLNDSSMSLLPYFEAMAKATVTQYSPVTRLLPACMRTAP